MNISFTTFISATFPVSTPIAIALTQSQSLPASFLDHYPTANEPCKEIMADNSFSKKTGQTRSFYIGKQLIHLISLGDADKLDQATFEKLGGTLQTLAQSTPGLTVLLDLPQTATTNSNQASAHLAFATELRQYQFTKYKTIQTDQPEQQNTELTFLVEDATQAQQHYQTLHHLTEGITLARDLVNEPPNVLYPETLAEKATELSQLGVEVDVLDTKALTRLGMRTLLAVGEGSEKESKVVVMRWKGEQAPEHPTLAVLGKGVTFDSGGLSLKPPASMEFMKKDMAGAATVIGLLKTLALRQAQAHVIGIIGLVENMPSGRALRPGDVITSMSGKTVEVLNTDAEGRLVLADLLTYAEQHSKASTIINLATLTGAIIAALGTHYAGLFSNSDELAAQLTQSGKDTNESLWQMPLDSQYEDYLKSDIADLKNVGGPDGGSIIAATFLKAFVNNARWAHLDIAGVAWARKDQGITPKGASGFGVRLLNHYIMQHHENQTH